MRKILLFIVIILISMSAFSMDRALVLKHMKQEQRVALLIGNSSYSSSPLRNPVNDVESMSSALKAMGFDVIKVENASQREMDEAISGFGGKLRNGGVGLFYYAGHGMQVGGENYLIPVDAEIDVEGDIKYRAVNVGTVLSKMEAAGNRLNIVFLDACRNNPFSRSWRSSTKGLAKVDAPTGTYIAYATAPGSVASDGTGSNGIFTEALIRAMSVKGLTIENVMKQVRVEVAGQTDRKQIPWTSSSLMGDFYFNLPDSGSEGYQAPVYNNDQYAMAKRPKAESTPGKYIDPAAGIEFVLIKGGCYMMGSADNSYGDQKPVHEVCVDDFYMSKYEVTNAQFRKYDSEHNSRDYNGHSLNGDNQPAVYVSWDDAKGFINWLNSSSDGKYRLPTEAEWEYAARGGTTTASFWGDDPDDACGYANVADKTSKKTWPHWKMRNCDDGYSVTSPVGSFKANSFGLYDIIGNVYEWVEDTYSNSAYSKHQRSNPLYKGSGDRRVIRGGSWYYQLFNVGSAYRSNELPDYGGKYIGFRLLRDVN